MTNFSMKKIRVGVIGVGNCFSGLIQGIQIYKNDPGNTTGLLNEIVGRYSFKDIEFVSAFDVDKNKIGKTLDRACFVSPNLVKWTKLPRSRTVVL